MIYYPPTKIYIKESRIQGRGVFASSDIQSGELLETVPIAVTKKNDKQPHEWSPQDLMFFKYNGGWGTWATNELTCVAFGYASLYNHNDQPNVRYEKNIEQSAINFYAIKDIKQDEECCILYYENYKTKFLSEVLNDRED